MRIDDAVINEIRHRARVSDVVRDIGLISLRKNGREFLAECPFHSDRKPSLTINDAKGFYKCFPCGAGGDAIKFVMDYLGVGFLDALARVGALYNIRVDAAPEDGLTEAQRQALRQERERQRGGERILRAFADAAEAGCALRDARRIWTDAQDAADVPLRYLSGRGIVLRGLPACLRSHRSLWHAPSETRWPGMVGCITGPRGFAGVHRTWLTLDGDKAPVSPVKMTLGSFFEAGACLRLQNAYGRVALAEGTESSLSAAQAIHKARASRRAAGEPDADLAWPVWSVLALEGFRRVVLPDSVREVMLLPDADESTEVKAGRRSGREAAHEVITQAIARFQGEGRTVHLFDTPEGMDINDMLRERT